MAEPAAPPGHDDTPAAAAGPDLPERPAGGLPEIRQRAGMRLRPLAPASLIREVVHHAEAVDPDLLHFRQRELGPTDICRADGSPEPDEAAAESLPEAVWGGYLFPHFGHFVAEVAHRLWPFVTDPRWRALPVVFHPVRPYDGGAADMPAWMSSILDYLQVSPQRIVLRAPTDVGLCHLPHQAKLLSGKFLSQEVVAALGRLPAPEDQGARRLYVSRARYLHAGSIFGEGYIEAMLRQAGFTVIYPEDMPVATLVGLYRQAEAIVFAEGSAIHALELCGRCQARAVVICRRPEAVARVLFDGAFEALGMQAFYYDAGTPVVPLSWGQKAGHARGKPLWYKAPTSVNLPDLFARMSEALGLALPAPDPAQAAAAARQDVLAYILDPRTTGKETGDEQLGALLRMLRAQVGRGEVFL